jgi:broad specificity phosphatase PhoE
MRLYLITHAETHQDRTTEVTQWRLSEQGQQQATILAQQPFWSQVERIVLSSEPKTRLTVEPLLTVHKLPLWVDAHFDELRRPGWTIDYTARVKQAFATPDQPAGEWEPANAAFARFLAGIAFIQQEFAGATLALVGHGLTLSLYRAYLLGQTRVNLADWQQLSFAAVALVDPEARHMLQDFQPVAGHSPRG